MKDLRQFLRRSGRLIFSRPRRRAASSSGASSKRRRLRSETLERRQLLAGDILLAHNYENPSDVNADSHVTPLDALAVINHLNRHQGSSVISGESISGASSSGSYVDVNADGRATALDALRVINSLNAEAEVDTLSELQVSPRSGPTTSLLDGENSATVEVGQVFELEVAYEDLRTEIAALDADNDKIPLGEDGEPLEKVGGVYVGEQAVDERGDPVFQMRPINVSELGAFQLVVDIPIGENGSGAGAMTPLITDVQQFTVDGDIRDNPSSQLRFVRQTPDSDDSNPQTLIAASDFIDDPAGTIESVLIELGFEADSFDVSEFDAANPDDFLVQARFDSLGVDNISLDSFAVEVESFQYGPNPESLGLSMSDPDGLQYAMNTAVRNIGGETFFDQQPFGTYDPDFGFDEVGSFGPLSPPGFTEREPFVGFSIPVVINQPVNDLEISVKPADFPGTPDNESVLLYGRDPQVYLDQIRVDQDGMFTINAVAPDGENTAPTFTDDIAVAALDDNDGPTTVTEGDLLSGAVDAQGDSLSVVSLAHVEGDTSGVTIVDGTSLSITPSAYDALQAGDSEQIVYAYHISDGAAESVERRVTVTIDGANDAPTAEDSSVNTQEGQPIDIDVSSLIDDVEGDSLAVSIGTDPSNGTATVNGTVITYTPSVAGPNSDSFTYEVSDGTAAPVEATIQVTILEANDPPSVGDPVEANFTEDDASATVDLLEGATDPESDNLSVSDVTLVSTGADTSGIVVDAANNQLNVTPSAYNGLAQGESEQVVYSYDVNDEGGNSVSQMVTVTIGGINDAPTAGDTSVTTQENSSVEIELSSLVDDPDGDSLTVTITTDPTNGTATVDGTVITYTPSVTGPASDSITYQVDDGIADPVEATISITIDEIDDPPVVDAPVEANFTEDDASATVDLLVGATDPEGDELSVSDVTLVSTGADTSGIVVDAANNQLNVTPSAYNGLAQGESEQIVYSFNVNDDGGNGTQQTVTVTINGANDAPTPVDDTASTLQNTARVIDVLENDVDPDTNDTLTITEVGDASNGTATIENGMITYTPAADFVGTDTFTYTVSDGTASAQANVSVEVQDFVPSTLSGSAFFDHVENIDEYISNGADPVRNGVQDDDETGLSGTPVRLVADDTGEVVDLAYTRLDGSYEFENVVPGDYRIVYEIPDTVVYGRDVGDAPGGSPADGVIDVSIGQAGGVTRSGLNFTLLATQGSSIDHVDLLASTYADNSDGLRHGGTVSFDGEGRQQWFKAEGDFDGVQHAELVFNQERDAALLTVIDDDGSVKTASLTDEQFVVSRDGTAAAFFGSRSNLEFADSEDDLIRDEFENYRQTIDQILSELGQST